MKIYFDNCCYNRYLDDLSIGDNAEELEAIKHIYGLCKIGVGQLFNSDVNFYEAQKNRNKSERELVLSLISRATEQINVDKEIINRADFFQRKGIKYFDSLHLAAAETRCDSFFTVDYNFEKKSKLIKGLNINVFNPLYWIENEELL